LSGCATVGSDRVVQGTCPPVVEYSREFQARAAEEMALLPEASVIAEMLSDYSVMREQARVCLLQTRSRWFPMARTDAETVDRQ
jgi:hypothetical protein